jgi:hypothetical protein
VTLPLDRKYTALTFVAATPDTFREDFSAWLDEHWFIYEEFERRTLRLWRNGRKHYGARSIWETMRFDSAIGELRGEWKLNDHRPPCLARLVMLMNPPLQGFFETRGREIAAGETAGP